MKKNKIDKDNSGKKQKKIKKKTMWGNTVAIHSILKKKNYKTKFSTSSILKKKSPHDLTLFIRTCNCNSQTTQY